MLKSLVHKAKVHEIPKGQAFEAVSFGFCFIGNCKAVVGDVSMRCFGGARVRRRTLCSVMNFNDIEW